MKILALDYDGVIVYSMYECLFIGFNAYLMFNPKTRLFNSERFTLDNFEKKLNENKEIVDKYKNLRAYCKVAYSWYSIFHIIENDTKVENQKDFDKIKNKLNIDSNLYTKYFYDERLKLQKQDYEKWLTLTEPSPIINKINSLKEKFELVLATNNRKDVIEGLLKKYNLNFNLIVDNTLSTNKTKQLEFIKNKYNINFSDIYFVDDQVAHFSSLIKLGVNCFLATWGYNNKGQQEEAEKLGAELVGEGDFLEKINK